MSEEKKIPLQPGVNMKEQDIRSIDELKQAAKLSSSVIDLMREMDCFKGMSESAQMTFFEVM